MQQVMQMHKYVTNVTYLSRDNISTGNNAGQGMAAPFNSYAACVVDYSLANNQLAKAFIVLSVFIPVCL